LEDRVLLIVFLIAVGLVLVALGLYYLLRPPSDKQTITVTGPGSVGINVPVALCMVVLGVALVAGASPGSRWLDKQFGGSTAVPDDPASPSPSDVRVTVTTPTDRARVSSDGFGVEGTVTGMRPDETLWLLDYDGGYSVDMMADVAGDTWTATDEQIGTGPLTVVLVVATPPCADYLNSVGLSDGNYAPRLPRGCAVVARRSVMVEP
jgi:uncharacterized protein YjeT (DUF2065 family)